jgi:hypothetical protein
MYQIGTLKLTWIDKKDYTILKSIMFKKNELQKALQSSKPFGNNFMLFELTENKNDSYSWKLLPYGDAKRFVNTMKLYDNILFKPFILLTIGFAFYGVYKSFNR